MNAERRRLAECAAAAPAWKKWGPYLSERQWGTVREDYSPHGNAWDYFPHDHARSRAYRWGEDGIAGFSDDQQTLCLSLALWNERDPILKERLFGLTNGEGNHGEDVKELYYYLDATPTHSYLKMLYKYPQAGFPYADLVAENRRRGIGAPEYELLDTGIFDDDRYFDVVRRIRASRRRRCADARHGSQSRRRAGALHLLPQLVFPQYLELETAPPQTRSDDGRPAPLRRASTPGHSVLPCPRGGRLFGPVAADRERDQRRASSIRSTADGPLQRCLSRLLDRRPRGCASIRARKAPRPPRIFASSSPHGDLRASACGCRRAAHGHACCATSTASSSSARAEADEFYADLQRDIEDEDARSCSARPSPA